MWVGVFGVSQVDGTSGAFVPSVDPGAWLDSFALYKPGGPFDLHINYTGRLQHAILGLPAGNTIDVSSQDGGRVALQGAAGLSGISVSLSGNDAGLFDVCYEAHIGGGASSGVKKNGEMLVSSSNIYALRVYLKQRGV